MKVMPNNYETDLKYAMKVMIQKLYNINHEELCDSVNVDCYYIPENLDSDNTPKINYTLYMRNGRKQEKKNCSKLFSDLVDCFVAEHYLTYVKSQHKK